VPLFSRCRFVARAVLVASVAVVPATWSTIASGVSVPGQVITVEASSPLSQQAVLRTWRLAADGHYVQVFFPVLAWVGVNGVRPTHEGLGRTPVGVFTMTEAFGSVANNGTRLPYVHVGPDDWWDENPASSHYNRLVVSPLSPGGDSENLLDAGVAYAHAVVINYNTNPVVKGAGSGFFLHVSFGSATEGCVAIPEGQLDQVMRWLNPSLHPVISINVGSKALTPVEHATSS
jgi:L,D-peptidoglycan transpeptidase YkuD (ErfK/YbiS/YcfS/YnhG family)